MCNSCKYQTWAPPLKKKKCLNMPLLLSICSKRKLIDREEKVSLCRLTPGGAAVTSDVNRKQNMSVDFCIWGQNHTSSSWCVVFKLPCLHLTTQSTVLYLFLWLLLLAGCWWLLGHTQLGGHSGRVLAADRAAG